MSLNRSKTKALEIPPETPNPPGDKVSVRQEERFLEAARELGNRQIESLRLYEPLPVSDQFHASIASERLLRGGNRSSKTLSACAEISRALCGCDPYDKYPKENGIAFMVGKNWKHVGDVFHRYLLEDAGFRIIQNEKGIWEIYQHWRPDHKDRYDESVRAPGFLPRRLIKDIAWEEKKRKTFSAIYMTNGWQLKTFSSDADPPVGSAVDIVLIDEDVDRPEWIPEMQARLADRQGKFVWATLPYRRNDYLQDMSARAADEMASGTDKPIIEEFVLKLRENPYIKKEEVDKQQKRYSAAEWAMRGEGEFNNDPFLVWPNFSMDVHGFNLEDLPNKQVPADWCRYMVVDPGRATCAVLFAVIPPPEFKGAPFVLLEDELYIRECTASKFGKTVSNKLGGKTCQAFIIDYHGSISHDMGGGLRVDQQYSAALRENNIKSHSAGYQFHPGTDKIYEREMMAGNWMDIRQEGPKLRCLRGKLPFFEWEIGRFKKKMVSGTLQDKGDYRHNAHLMACLGYLVGHNPRYVKPKSSKRNWGIHNYFNKKQARERAENKPEDSYVNLGPGGGKSSNSED